MTIDIGSKVCHKLVKHFLQFLKAFETYTIFSKIFGRIYNINFDNFKTNGKVEKV